jgi:hypothetical protein
MRQEEDDAPAGSVEGDAEPPPNHPSDELSRLYPLINGPRDICPLVA